MRRVTLVLDAPVRPTQPGDRVDGFAGYIDGMTEADITEALGVQATPMKANTNGITRAWYFKVGPYHCAVWDYKGSPERNRWSAGGSVDALRAVFDANFLAARAAA